MKAKVIMLKSKEYSDIQLGMNNKLHKEDGTSIALKDYQHIYLIDSNVKIKEGDRCINNNQDTLYQPNCLGDLSGWNKIICSTDKSINHKDKDDEILRRCQLSYLSEQSVKLLIDYYNKNGKMLDEVDVEFTEGFYEGVLNILKLNSQGTVDITIPEEKMYSRKEVESLFIKFRMDTRDFNTEIFDDELEDWIDKNL